MTARVEDLTDHLALRALARKLDLIVPRHIDYEDLLTLIAQRVKDLGWPKRWPLDSVHGPGDAHGTFTMYARGCRCPRCVKNERPCKDRYTDKPSEGFIPTLLRIARVRPARFE